MKRIVMYLCLLTAMSASCQTQKGYRLTGQLEGLELWTLLFKDGSGKKEGTKRVLVNKNGKFKIKGSHKGDRVYIATLVSYNMHSTNQSGGGIAFGGEVQIAVQNGDHIRITATKDNFKWATVTGNAYNEYLNGYRKLVKKNKVAIEDLNAEIKELAQDNADGGKINQKKEKIAALQEKINETVLALIKQDPNQLMNLVILNNEKKTMTYEEFNKGYQSLSDEVRESKLGQSVRKSLDLKKKVEASSIGEMAKDFEKVDKDGNLIRLSDFRGKKYVLLDFWGSWCAPCRASHPHLKELYEKYKDEGLEVIGIAEEKGREAWLNAIEEDGLPWLQILNYEGKEKTDVVDMYGITAFPTKILIDKEGRIIHRDIAGKVAVGAKGPKSPAALAMAGGAIKSVAWSLDKKLKAIFGK